MSPAALPNRYAAGTSQHPLAPNAVGEVAGALLEGMQGEDPDLVCFFASPHHLDVFDELRETLRDLLDPRTLLGVTTGAVIGGAREVETGPALAGFAARLPDAEIVPVGLDAVGTPDGTAITGWPAGDPSHGPPGETLLLLADPFSFPVDGLLRGVEEQARGLSIVGGMASAAQSPGGNRLALDEETRTAGAVGAFLRGARVRTVVSQGCRPVGDPYIVTAAHDNVIETLGGEPAVSRLQELAERSTPEERELVQRGLHVGVVVDEHRAEFERGDFLVRNVVGIDASEGFVAIGDVVPVGRTVQFHVRDAAAADEDLRALVSGVDDAAGALLFTCNGRGQRLFGVPDHDAGVVEDLLAPVSVAGGFCAGEIGPVGGRNFLHGFTASLAIFPSGAA